MREPENIRQIFEQLESVSAPVTASPTLPPACYTSDEFHRLELERIFRQGWIGVGRSDRCRDSGDYFTLDLGGVEAIIVRDEEGELRAFANSCRHRGSAILEGEGSCRVMMCPFHGWTYGLNGELVSAPRMDSAENFDRAEYGLVEFRLQCRDGLAFVCLDPGTPGLEQWLGDFPDIHWPWALDQLVSTRVQQLDVGCNWKAFIEVFNEYYHLPFVHPDSLNGMYGEPDPADLVLGQYTTQFGITDGSPALFAGQREHALPPTTRLQGRLLLGTRYTWVYPNLTFAAGPDSLWMYEVYPRGAGRCHVVQTICFPPNAVELEDFEERARYYYARHDEALAEDLPALERQQRGLGSPFARQGRFADLEPGVGNFGCWYARAMRLGAGKTID